MVVGVPIHKKNWNTFVKDELRAVETKSLHREVVSLAKLVVEMDAKIAELSENLKSIKKNTKKK